MELMRRLFFYVMVILFTLSSFSYPAAAATPSNLRVSQAYTELPQITAYFDVTDVNGAAVTDINATEVLANLGANAQSVSAIKSFEQSGEGIAYVFLVDVSKSLQQGQFDQIKEALKGWSDTLGPNDRAAIITLGSSVKVTQDFTADKQVLNQRIGELTMTDDQTQLHRGLAQAIETARQMNQDLPKRRVIITLSDGEDDFVGGMTKDEVLDRMKVDRIPVYAIGFAEPPLTKDKETSLKKLGEFARMSGGEYFQAGAKPLPELYKDMRQKIRSGYVAVLNTQLAGDGSISRLQLTYKVNGQTFTDGLDIRLLASTAPQPEQTQPQSAWDKIIAQPLGVKVTGVIVLVLLVVGSLFLVLRQRRQAGARQEALRLQEEQAAQLQSTPSFAASQVGATQQMNVKQQCTPDWEAEQGGAKQSSTHIMLTVLGGADARQRYNLSVSDKVTIGRRSGNTIAITSDAEISGTHCQLWLEDRCLMIGDLGSTNGTYVNGVAISNRHRLQHDDVIMIGRTELRVSIDNL